MKKLLSILALALCFVACQNEAVESVNNGDLANVVLTIDAPELGVTRADGDTLVDGTPKNGKNSAYGAIDFLSDADWANYDLRYILEVYGKDDDGTGEPIYRERLVNCLDKYAPTTFELRLVPERTYKFVVFADFVAEGSAEATDKLAIADLYYNTADLNNISAITTEQTWGAMNEIRDAYFISQNVKVTNGLNETLTLTRPFAKLRVIATDLDYIKGYSEPGYVVVQYHDTDIIKSFNAVNGKLNTDTMTEDERTYKFNVNKATPYTEGYDAETTNQTLFTDYLFAVEGEQTPVNFTIAVYEDATMTKLINEHDFNTQIPIQRNHLTTLIGDILTTQANITIEIDDNFADPEYVVGYKDPNLINAWESGVVNTDGNFEFTINKGENEFTVIVNGAAVQNKQLTVGNYVWEPNAEDAEDGSHLTFTVKNLPATRAVATVEVLDGTMNVAVNKDKEGEYIITLDLLTKNNDGQTHRSVYEYTGAILFGETLDTPVVETNVEGNTITVSWAAVEGATSYFVAMNGEEAVETTELSKVYTDLEWETEYTFSVYAKSDTLISVTATVKATTEAAPVVDPEEPKALATPVVTAVAKENTVTLTWEAVENAASYSITVGTEMPVVTEELTYTFTGEYETEYTFNVVAVPADEEKFAASEAAVVTATTEAAPAVTPETKSVTVAEFLTMPEDETEGAAKYRLTGVITRMYRVNNSNDTLYGNFYLKDATGEVLIFGLMDKDGNKYWETSGAKIGDTITVETVRTSYNNAPQGKNSTFIELVPFVETASEWGVVGDLTNWSDNGNIPDIVMYNTWKAENLFVAYNVEIASGAFKIRANNEWNDAKNYGLAAAGKIYADKYYTLTKGAGSQNATPMVYGTYDVYFDLANERVALVTPGKEYADAVEGGDPVVVIEGLTDHEWGLVGSFADSNWSTDVAMEVNGDWAVAKNVTLANGDRFKFRADGDWALSYGSACDVNVGETYTTFNNGSDMIFVGENGAYNVYFSLVDAKFYMEAYSAATTVTFNVADYNFANQTALTSYTVGDVTIAFDGGGNNNSPKYYTSGTAVRCYPKNTITVSGKTIKKVEVVAPDGYTNAIDLYNDSTKLDNFTWEGSSKNVVLTFDPNQSSGQSRFVKINVTYE